MTYLVGFFLLLGENSAKSDEIGYDGDNVDDIHDALEEDELERTANEAHDELEREPDDAHGLDEEERLVEMRYVVFDDGEVRRVRLVQRGRVGLGDAVALEVRQRLEAECDDAREDYGHRDDGDDARPLRRLRVLEQQPDLALKFVCRQDSFFFFDETFFVCFLVLFDLFIYFSFD
jgi:hypothetical protein